MGQQLIGRPVSQRSGFPTLGTASSAQAPNLSQYLGFLTPPQAPAQQMQNPAMQRVMGPPSTLGFGGFGGLPRWGGNPRQFSG